MKKIKSKKTLIAIVLIGILAIGGTLAYYTSSATFDNVFETAEYKTVATEVFESPTNWKPGDTTPKTITVKNEGDINARVRVCIEDSWLAADGITTLPNHDTTNNIDIAVINPANTSDWAIVGRCYYYLDELEPNETTTSPIESVTFNPLYEGSVECTTDVTGKVKTCESTNTGYDGATYTLTLTAETIQSDGLTEWGFGYIGTFDPSSGGPPTYYADSDSVIAATGYDTFLNENLTSEGYVFQVGFRKSGVDYYLKIYDETAYESNKTILNTAFGQTSCDEEIVETNKIYTCETDDFKATIKDYGYVDVINFKENRAYNCNSDFGCNEITTKYSATGEDRYETSEEAMAAKGHFVFLKIISGVNPLVSVGFKQGNNEYYLEGGGNGSSYAKNKAILENAFGVSNCYDYSSRYECYNESFQVFLQNNGHVSVMEEQSKWNCFIIGDGSDFSCNYNEITH